MTLRGYDDINGSYGDGDFDSPAADDHLMFPGERIGAPPPHSKGASMLSAMLVVAAMLLCVWAAMATREIWQGWLPQRTVADASPPAKVADAPLPSIASAPEIQNAPGRDAGTPVEPTPSPGSAATASDPENISGDEEVSGQVSAADGTGNGGFEKPEPLAKPVFDSKDPLQRRAYAAGLHPDLSRTLLSRLSKTDFLNARIAIAKAMKQFEEGGKVIWPKAASKRGAQFEVHFVAASAADCRRYVVTIIKDRWSTTALPIEKCGVELTSYLKETRSGV